MIQKLWEMLDILSQCKRCSITSFIIPKVLSPIHQYFIYPVFVILFYIIHFTIDEPSNKDQCCCLFIKILNNSVHICFPWAADSGDPDDPSAIAISIKCFELKSIRLSYNKIFTFSIPFYYRDS